MIVAGNAASSFQIRFEFNRRSREVFFSFVVLSPDCPFQLQHRRSPNNEWWECVDLTLSMERGYRGGPLISISHSLPSRPVESGLLECESSGASGGALEGAKDNTSLCNVCSPSAFPMLSSILWPVIEHGKWRDGKERRHSNCAWNRRAICMRDLPLLAAPFQLKWGTISRFPLVNPRPAGNYSGESVLCLRVVSALLLLFLP